MTDTSLVIETEVTPGQDFVHTVCVGGCGGTAEPGTPVTTLCGLTDSAGKQTDGGPTCTVCYETEKEVMNTGICPRNGAVCIWSTE